MTTTKISARIRSHLRRNLIGLVALFVVLGGTAAALPGKNTVDSGDIKKQAVKTSDIAKQAVKEKKLADGAVTGAKVADGSLTGAKIADLGIGTADLAANAVGTPKIATDAVTEAKIAPNAVTTAKVAPNAVTAEQLGDDSVRAAELGPTTVVTASTSIQAGPAFADGAVVNCPAGSQVISGGAQVSNLDLQITANTVTDGNGWYAAGEYEAASGSANLTIRALCLDV